MTNTTLSPRKIKPDADWRQFRLRRINEESYRHAWLLLFWPIFGLLFGFVERYYPVQNYHAMYCPLDDVIPFNEIFLLPYLFWFIFLGGTVAFLFFYDTKAFRRMMYFTMFTYAVTIAVYFLFPTCQELRPLEFSRDNFLTQFMAAFYAFDTNTNVCPSLHVIGSVVAMLGGLDCKWLQSRGWKIFFVVSAVLISISTVFLKQHSLLDVLWAIPLCIVGWLLFYVWKKKS